MYICLCRAVSDEEIKQAIRSGAHCTDALESELGVSTQCGKCKPDVKALLQQTLLEDPTLLPTPIKVTTAASEP